MVLGCGLPLLLIFLAPSVGAGSGIWLFSFIAVMFAVHLLMPIHHKDHSHGLSEDNLKKKHKEKVENYDH